MATTEADKEQKFTGVALSTGVGVARVCLFNEHRHSKLPMYDVAAGDQAEERERLDKAFEIVRQRLEELRQDVEQRIGKAEAEIFTAQRMIVEDETLRTNIFRALTEHEYNAESAVTAVMDSYREQLEQVDNEYMRGRASDLDEVRKRLLDAMSDTKPGLQCSSDVPHCQKGNNRIIVAEELTPSLTIELDAEHTIGFVTERGGVNSHAAILAKSLGIPAVSGIKGLHQSLSCGTELLVDGDNGEVVLNPAEETIRQVTERRKSQMRYLKAVEPVSAVEVLASINRAGDVEDAIHMKAEGIGLYRTEFEFFTAGQLLDEDEQLACYGEVVSKMEGKPVYIRMLDVGADKPLPFIDSIEEENPALGYRGARFLLGNPELLKTQARAVARASREGPVYLMVPMIAGINQYRKIKELITEAIQDITDTNLRLGVMFEIPSACLQPEAEKLLQEADFGSIGSNDLLQYLFAVDRNNAYVSYDYSPDQPALWELIDHIVAAGNKTGKPVSLCGEIGADPAYVPALVERGIPTLSASPRLIPDVRSAFS